MTGVPPRQVVRKFGSNVSNRCIADTESNLHLSDQRRRVTIWQDKTPCGATSFGIAYRDARNGGPAP